MAPPSWMHCNYCYYLFASKTRKMYQMSCLHLLCRNCMVHTNRGKICPICKREITKLDEIANDMDPKVKCLYSPDTTKMLEHVFKIQNFQRKQKKHLIDQLLVVDQKLRKLKEHDEALRLKIVEYQQRHAKLREKRKALQYVQHRTSESTPKSAGSSSGGRSSSKALKSGKGNSFLDLKGNSSASSTESRRSVDFGSTPNSGTISPSIIGDQLNNLRIDRST